MIAEECLSALGLHLPLTLNTVLRRDFFFGLFIASFLEVFFNGETEDEGNKETSHSDKEKCPRSLSASIQYTRIDEPHQKAYSLRDGHEIPCGRCLVDREGDFSGKQ